MAQWHLSGHLLLPLVPSPGGSARVGDTYLFDRNLAFQQSDGCCSPSLFSLFAHLLCIVKITV